jgi:MoCo/4Fe-4S cofactor protein with predicted Tat translocation signal
MSSMNHRQYPQEPTGLSDVRGRLAGARGPQFWRSLEELAGTDEFQEYLGREFPSQASEWTDPVGRRQFLKLMGASLALAGVSGCAFQPPETIVPYVKAPEEFASGRPRFFASALTHGGFASGVLVESWMGRPTKVEGNPDFPSNLGGTDPFLQASILDLYDPDRSQVVTRNGRVSTWEDFLSILGGVRSTQKTDGGAGLRILTETVTSPTLVDQIQAVLKEFPKAKWYQYDPVGRDEARKGIKLAFGEDVEPVYHIDKADVIVSLDADFTTIGPGRLREAREFTARRDADAPAGMNRLYVVEPTPSCTGSLADHRLAAASHQVPAVALAIAKGVGVPGITESKALPERLGKFVEAVIADLKAKNGAGLVLAGVGQPAVVHALAHAINQTLGNVGKTVEFVAPIEPDPADRVAGIRELFNDMMTGKVSALLIAGGNPVYDAPADVNFAAGLNKVTTSIRLGLYDDETSFYCHWHIPAAHPLETWGDALGHDGTATIAQPLIAPLYAGKSAIEVVAALADGTSRTGLEIVRAYWQKQKPGAGWDEFWKKTLRNGFVEGSASKPKAVTLKPLANPVIPSALGNELEVIFRPDPAIWDGRFANNGWLQELPKPFSRTTWENAAYVSPKTAERLGLTETKYTGETDIVEIKLPNATVKIPVWIVPGQAEETITLHLGYGRTRSGRVGTGIGSNVYVLRDSTTPWTLSGVTLTKTGERTRVASIQHLNMIDPKGTDGDLIRVGTQSEYKDPKTRGFAQEPDKHFTRDLTLFEDPLPQLKRENGEGNSWGMTIDLNTCIGCNACVVACQAENNGPVVGKEQVLKGRHMHWIRIDRYYEGSVDAPKIHHQPLLCMHCEKAPCEVVCPVAATTHSAEGLNEMIYNRCVGTRYCSNNCPYKVRRFNFLQFSDESTPSLKLMRNPEVTVRPRGVMEKCTYCVQRISVARITAEKENRRVGGNEVVTACQGACPTKAITFGNLNDPGADVVKLKQSPRNYALLAELNVRPRTTYLAKLTNPNPALQEGRSDGR